MCELDLKMDFLGYLTVNLKAPLKTEQKTREKVFFEFIPEQALLKIGQSKLCKVCKRKPRVLKKEMGKNQKPPKTRIATSQSPLH